MNRLTQWFGYGNSCRVAGIASHLEEKHTAEELVDILAARLAEYEDTGMEPEHITALQTAVRGIQEGEYIKKDDNLNELLQAQSEGRLVVLPCKVGDTVYEVQNNTDACLECAEYSSFYGMDALCGVADGEDRYSPRFAKRPICEKQHMEIVERNATLDYICLMREHFGKTLFVTREEAEEALGADKNVGGKGGQT